MICLINRNHVPIQMVTVYIDDASIDDWSSMLASSFLSKSTIEIDDPS